MIIRIFFFLSLLILIMCSCSQKSDGIQSARVWFNTHRPEKKMQEKNFEAPAPTTSASISCVAVMIDYPDVNSGNYCDLSDSGMVLFDQMTMITARNSDFFAEVRMGLGISFHLIGFSTDSGSCPEAGPSLTNDQQLHLSSPLKLATAVQNVLASETTVSLTGIFSGSSHIVNCSGSLLNWTFLSATTTGTWDVGKWDEVVWGP